MDQVLEPVQIVGESNWDAAKVFTPEALEFLTALHNRFEPTRQEDAATAEISRVQLWRWIHSDAKLDDGTVIDQKLYEELKIQVLSRLKEQMAGRENRLKEAVEVLDSVTASDELVDFLTIKAYDYLSKE